VIPSPILDEMWEEFRELARAEEKLPSSPVEWTQGWDNWRGLDPDQKRKAIEYLRSNDGMETTHSNVVSYLRLQKYLRPTPKARAAKKESELERRMREA
jgi:hypothetical protein